MYMQTCAVAVGAAFVYANTACAFTDIANAVGTAAACVVGAAAAALLPTFTKIMTLLGQKVWCALVKLKIDNGC